MPGLTSFLKKTAHRCHVFFIGYKSVDLALRPRLLLLEPFSWWRHQMETFPRYWPFVRGIHRSPVNFPHKGQWRGALKFSWICVWINGWVNNREAGDLRRYRAHHDVIVMCYLCWSSTHMHLHICPSVRMSSDYSVPLDTSGSSQRVFLGICVLVAEVYSAKTYSVALE